MDWNLPNRTSSRARSELSQTSLMRVPNKICRWHSARDMSIKGCKGKMKTQLPKHFAV
jgi:hypothetical protein